jgi:hypothetical protein
MEIAGFSLLGASMLTSCGLSFGVTEQFGNLTHNGTLAVDAPSGQLTNSYADALVALSSITLAFLIFAIAWFLYKFTLGCNMVKSSAMRASINGLRIFFFLVVLISFAACVMNISLVASFSSLVSNGSVTYEPSPAPADANYTLRGSFPIGLIVLNSITLVGLFISICWWGDYAMWRKGWYSIHGASTLTEVETYEDSSGERVTVRRYAH